MRSFDLRKKIITPANPRHSVHQTYLAKLHIRLNRFRWIRFGWAGCFLIIGFILIGNYSTAQETSYFQWSYQQQANIQKIRINTIARNAIFPVEQHDPKTDALARFLEEKRSPLKDYAGLLSRMENWKLLVGIAHAESNLCRKTQKNNCWGIGPGSPFYYNDISESLYHANYLIEKFGAQGMKKPETLVRTYVGYYNPSWIEAINDVLFELQERGIN